MKETEKRSSRVHKVERDRDVNEKHKVKKRRKEKKKGR